MSRRWHPPGPCGPGGGSIGSRWGLRGALSEEVGWGELLKGRRKEGGGQAGARGALSEVGEAVRTVTPQDEG